MGERREERKGLPKTGGMIMGNDQPLAGVHGFIPCSLYSGPEWSPARHRAKHLLKMDLTGN